MTEIRKSVSIQSLSQNKDYAYEKESSMHASYMRQKR